MPSPRTTGTSRTLLGTNQTYANKILTLFGQSSVVAFWPQNEVAGAVSKDISGHAYNGAYTGVTLGAAGIGDGNTAASFDGTTSFNNVYSAGLAGAFNNQELTIITWPKVSGAGVWTDGAARRVVSIGADASNVVYLRKIATNNTFSCDYIAGGTGKAAGFTLSTTIFNMIAITVSKSGDALIAYLNGVQQGATVTGLGVWSGALAATLCCIGATSTAPLQPWSGSIGPALLLNRAATAAEILQAATV